MNGLLIIAVAAVPAFFASVVEFVEALTIVLAVGITRGWRYPLLGAAAAAVSLAVITGILGVALATVIPIKYFLMFVGTLLLLFGLRWLRKCILRFAGIVALHDEELIYQREVAELKAKGLSRQGRDWVGFVVAYKAVLLEGLEIAFIVITIGTGGATKAAAVVSGACSDGAIVIAGQCVPLSWAAAITGAIAAGILVIGAGVLLKQPLTQIPENTLKFGVGALLTTFGVFWSGEGFGVEWPGDSAALLAIFVVFLVVSWVAIRMLKAMLPQGARVAARNV